MRTFETRGLVSPDGYLSVWVPHDITPGEDKVVVVIDEEPVAMGEQPLPAFPVIDPGPWPADLALRREDMYGDDGR